jgi:ABC-type tungstate transport system permease subunit
MSNRRMLISLAIALALTQVSVASAQQNSIVVASTTSTEDSGLFDFARDEILNRRVLPRRQKRKSRLIEFVTRKGA